MHENTKRIPNNGGFTLMELIVVVIILAMMTAGVTPMFRDSLRSLKRHRVVDEFVAVMQHAHERAILDGVPYRFYVNEDDDTYWVTRFEKRNEKGEDVYEPFENLGRPKSITEFVDIRRVTARLERDDDGKFIVFYPTGSSDEARIGLYRREGKPVIIKTKQRAGQFEITDQED